MAKDCVTEKTVLRQEWIENGLLELMREKTLDEITVTALCRHLTLSRRSFYRYFQDLEDVLDSALNRLFQQMVILNRVPELEEIRENYAFWFQHRQVLDALHRSGMIDKLFDYTMRYSDVSAIGLYLDEETKQADLGREASMFIIGGSIALIISWYAGGFTKTPEEMAKIAYRMLYQPVLKK